jgi:signal transduction histidine kinase
MNNTFRSLPVRYALLAFACAVIGATGLGAFIGWRANQMLADRSLESISIEAAALNSEYRSGGLPRLKLAIDARVLAGGPMRYWLADQTRPNAAGSRIAGNLMEAPRLAGASSANSSPAAEPDPDTTSTFNYQLASSPDVSRLAVGLRIIVSDATVLVVARDLADQQSFVHTIQLALGAGIIGLSLLAGFGTRAARGYFAARVDAVTDTARTIISGNLDQRIALTGTGDEIDRLSANLNEMLNRMSLLMASLREVSDNIAHDLKTPLNRLRNRAEAALRDPAGGPAYRDGLERTIEEADGLIRTFNALLLIARLEASTVTDSMSVIDPATVVADVAELYQPVAEEAGRSLVTEMQTGLKLRANRQLLGQVISNLVENAIKYGVSDAPHATDKRISLSLRSSKDGVEIAVSDHGPGIREADRERALKRFVRLEESRSQPGTGLGLSLVAAVARLHGGSIRLEDNQPGLRVVVHLPAASQSITPHMVTS